MKLKSRKVKLKLHLSFMVLDETLSFKLSSKRNFQLQIQAKNSIFAQLSSPTTPLRLFWPNLLTHNTTTLVSAQPIQPQHHYTCFGSSYSSHNTTTLVLAQAIAPTTPLHLFWSKLLTHNTTTLVLVQAIAHPQYHYTCFGSSYPPTIPLHLSLHKLQLAHNTTTLVLAQATLTQHTTLVLADPTYSPSHAQNTLAHPWGTHYQARFLP